MAVRDEPDDEDDGPRSQLDKVAAVGNGIQLLFVVPLPLLLTLYCGYLLVVSLVRREFGGAFGAGLCVLLFGAVTYALVKSYWASLRTK